MKPGEALNKLWLLGQLFPEAIEAMAVVVESFQPQGEYNSGVGDADDVWEWEEPEALLKRLASYIRSQKGKDE